MILVFVSAAMEQDLSPAAEKKEVMRLIFPHTTKQQQNSFQSCTDLGGGDEFFTGKDHTNFLVNSILWGESPTAF